MTRAINRPTPRGVESAPPASPKVPGARGRLLLAVAFVLVAAAIVVAATAGGTGSNVAPARTQEVDGARPAAPTEVPVGPSDARTRALIDDELRLMENLVNRGLIPGEALVPAAIAEKHLETEIRSSVNPAEDR